MRLAPDYDLIDASNLHIMGRDRVINGSIDIKDDLGENYKLNVTFYSDSAGTGDWKLVPFRIQNYNPCAALADFASYLEPSLIQGENTNLMFKDNVCPIPRNTYFFRDISVNTDSWPNAVPRGPAKSILTFAKDGKYVGEFEFYFKIENTI